MKIKTGKAFLLDGDRFLLGTIKRKGFKKVFMPDLRYKCGFDYQYLYRGDVGRIIFYDDALVINLSNAIFEHPDWFQARRNK
jgi:hypothetical protein